MPDSIATVTRVDYREGKVLSAPDLLDEQAYLISLRQFHATESHRWGIIRGLVPSINGGSLQVSSGLAVDGFGRHLIVSDRLTADISALRADSVLILLTYSLDPAGSAAAGQNTRWTESALLRLEHGSSINPRQFETGATEWPILLGILERSLANASYKVNVNSRPLIGLRGEIIAAASDAVHIRLGPEFAVRVPAAASGEHRLADNLRVDTAGNLAITGDSQLTGNLVIEFDAALAPSGRIGLGFGEPIDPPRSASSWNMYHTEIDQKDGPPQNQVTVQLTRINIELPPVDDNNPGGITAAIGREADGKFQSCLTVSPRGDVTIHGTLRVQGSLYEGTIAADPTDPRFLVNLSNAVAGNSADVGPGPLTVEVGGPDKFRMGEIPYSLGFTNNGTTSIRVVQVQEILTVDNKLVPSPAVPIERFTIHPNGTETKNRLVSVRQAGKLAVGVRVTGAAPDGSAIYAKDAMFIQVTD